MSRLQHFTLRFRRSNLAQFIDQSPAPWSTPLALLAHLTMDVLLKSSSIVEPHLHEDLVSLLLYLASQWPDRISPSVYYRTLAHVLNLGSKSGHLEGSGILESSIQALLRSSDKASPRKISIYEGFAHELLVVPELPSRIDLTSISVDYEILTTSILRHFSALNYTRDQLLWQLAYFIYFGRRRGDQQTNGDYVKIISTMISLLADEIETRMAAERINLEDEDGLVPSRPPALPPFVEEQVSSLVNQQSISGLLAQFEAVSTSFEDDSESSKQTSALATYALTLFRVFPRKGDEIRMWLFLGGTARGSEHKVPAVKYFFEASRLSNVYDLIKKDPRQAIDLLRANQGAQPSKMSIRREARDRQWRVIMIFMELYSFVLKFMDDEEFLSGSSSIDSSQSWSRQSALSIDQIADLTVFLKHLAFTLYRHTSDIIGFEEPEHRDSIAEYFSIKSGQVRSERIAPNPSKLQEASIAGMPGMTLAYFKGTVTGLLRMIYERDSRRKFLPSGHWLMTGFFDMDQFVKAVVEEEKEKQKIEDSYDEANEDPLDPLEEDERDDTDNLVGTG